MMDDDEVIRQRLSGKSVRAIAKDAGCSAGKINTVIDTWAESQLGLPEMRRTALALELGRLDELMQTFYFRALSGDVHSGALVAKIIERRGVMLGLHAPQTAVLKVIDDAAPKETSTDRIEKALDALIEDQRRAEEKKDGGGPTSH